MSGYTDPFGGSSVQPAQVAYRAVTLSANVTLVWPPQSVSATDYVARVMDVTATAGSLAITLPDARVVSPGFDVIITNVGANTFTVRDSAGGTIVTVTAGQCQYLYIRTNVTAAGTWGVFQFASTTSVATAAALAGLGIIANGAVLDNYRPATTVPGNLTQTASDKAGVFVWTSAGGTLTLLAAAPTGFFVSLANIGVGTVTFGAGIHTVNGSPAAFSLTTGESVELHSVNGVTNSWVTVGGRPKAQAFSYQSISIAVTTGTVTLTLAQAFNVGQKYTGALVGNVVVEFPVINQVYFVTNATTNAFTVTFRTPGLGTTQVLAQGATATFVVDGIDVRRVT